MDLDSTQTSRGRLLLAGKTLFAKNGFEATSTASIAREAGTSESQLVRYFGGKAGLLEAIFNASWEQLNPAVEEAVRSASSLKDAVLRVLSLLIEAFSRDQEIAVIFLFEGRRIRGGEHEVFISEGFSKFNHFLEDLIRSAQERGEFRSDLSARALIAALVGSAEGMVRDCLAADRLGRPSPFTNEELKQVFSAIVEGL